MTDTIDRVGRAIGRFADEVLHGAADAPTVAIGPVLWGIEPGHQAKHYYFMVASADAADKFHVGVVGRIPSRVRRGTDRPFPDRRTIVIRDFDDELRLARFCKVMWPCDKTSRILAGVESERGVVTAENNQ